MTMFNMVSNSIIKNTDVRGLSNMFIMKCIQYTYNRCQMSISISNCVLNRFIISNDAHIYLAAIMLEIMPAKFVKT